MVDPRFTPRYPVRLVVARTGLSPHVLRAWERRYRVVEPARSDGGQRLYSDRDIDRLQLLRRLTLKGHGIGGLASLAEEELERLARDELPAQPPLLTEEHPAGITAAIRLAIRRLDAGELQSVLERAVVTLGVPAFLEAVAGPALQAVGEGWREGTLTVGHEHLASAVFRRVLGWIMGLYEAAPGAPLAVVATPPRHVHELGAMLVAASVAAEGWGVTYLGADLPAEDIVGAARQVGARLVALSLVYPDVDPQLTGALERIRSELPEEVTLVVGGAAALSQREPLERLGARVVDSLRELRVVLREARR